MVKVLHEGGAKILPDFLSEAAQESAVSTYEYLLENGNTIDACFDDLNYPGFWNPMFVLPDDNVPPLGSAIARGNTQSVAKMINLGASVEQECDRSSNRKDEFSAIIHAAYFGDPRVIRLLIRSGANPNRILNGMTPLSITADEGHYEAARELLANGAFHTYSDDLKQPIEYAIEWGHEDIVELLVYAGATRPRQARSSELFEEVVDALVKGVVIVGTVYVIVEGLKYYGYASGTDAYTYEFDPDLPQNCLSDSHCGPYGACVSGPRQVGGTCMKTVDRYGIPVFNKSGSSDRRSNGREYCRIDIDCPLGYGCHPLFRACLKGWNE
jgi:hypothetical protein